MIKAALKYIERGWYVFPLHTIENDQCTCGVKDCSDAGKHPRLSRGLKEASVELVDINKWFGKDSPPSNIAIVTGEISNLTVIDIDLMKEGGTESWLQLTEEHGEPNTLYAETGSGGMHALFLYNSALKTSSNTLGKGIDVRNDNGYIVAAPSMHRSGKEYKWVDWETKLCALPSFLATKKETRGRPKKDDVTHKKYTLEQVEEMLDFIPSDDRDDWRQFGIILGREFARKDDAWEVYVEWAEKGASKKGRGHDAIMRQAFYELSQESANKNLTLGTIIKKAIENGWVFQGGAVPIEHFIYLAPDNAYVYLPVGDNWLATAVDSMVTAMNVNGRIVKPSEWLRTHKACTSKTSDPSMEEKYIKGFDAINGERIKVDGAAMYNSYMAPRIESGDPELAWPFVDHCKKVFDKEGDAEQFLNYMAHRIQKPWEKPRFALLIAGGQGVGKDTAIEFCVKGMGEWNCHNIEPASLDSDFNEFISGTLLRINEAANQHDMSKWAFNERTKIIIAGTPDSATINPKYGQKYSMNMHCGVVITTNHMLSGIYIPPDDRRYDVIECATLEEMGLADEVVKREYFNDLWVWYNAKGGKEHVVGYLRDRDISTFNPNTGQRKTEAHKSIVISGKQNDNWLSDI